MSTGRYTAEELCEFARRAEKFAHVCEQRGRYVMADAARIDARIFRQDAETESQVMGLVELVKQAYEEGVTDTDQLAEGDWEHSHVREALSKFRGDVE